MSYGKSTANLVKHFNLMHNCVEIVKVKVDPVVEESIEEHEIKEEGELEEIKVKVEGDEERIILEIPYEVTTTTNRIYHGKSRQLYRR